MLTNDKKAGVDPRLTATRLGVVKDWHSQCQAPGTCTCQHSTSLEALSA